MTVVENGCWAPVLEVRCTRQIVLWGKNSGARAGEEMVPMSIVSTFYLSAGEIIVRALDVGVLELLSSLVSSTL